MPRGDGQCAECGLVRERTQGSGNQSRRDYLLLTASKPLRDPLECQNGGRSNQGRRLLRFQSERKYPPSIGLAPCGFLPIAPSARTTDHDGVSTQIGRLMMLMSRQTFAVASAVIAMGLSCPAHAQDAKPAEQSVTFFQNVRIFDGKSAALSSAMNVLVRGTTIEKISEDTPPTDLIANAKVIAGGGRTLMPGLIDMHWHTMLVRPTPAAPSLDRASTLPAP